MRPKKRTGRRLRREALEMFPALKALGRVTVKADPGFTREATGIGDIEYFGPGQRVVRYPSGAEFKHPGPDRRHAVLFNPETNNAQAVALDMLHGMSEADPKFRGMLQEFGEALGEDDVRYWYEQDLKEGYAGDGYEQYRQNYIDGKLRNLLFEGSEEDFARSRYNPRERQDMREYNPRAYQAFEDIQRYLKSNADQERR
jgi:hypothetical protein